jgi:hypothetical protein
MEPFLMHQNEVLGLSFCARRNGDYDVLHALRYNGWSFLGNFFLGKKDTHVKSSSARRTYKE